MSKYIIMNENLSLMEVKHFELEKCYLSSHGPFPIFLIFKIIIGSVGPMCGPTDPIVKLKSRRIGEGPKKNVLQIPLSY